MKILSSANAPTTPVRLRPAPAVAPLRGTQSFVSVMAQIWKRPGLSGTELLWRWGVGAPLLLILLLAARKALRGVPFDLVGLEQMTVFKPTEALLTIHHQLDRTLPAVMPVLRWWIPCALGSWTLALAWGRSNIWLRLESRLRPNFVLVAAFTLVRICALLAVLALWIRGLMAASNFTVTTPANAGAEPNLVLFVALAVALTLLLFMFWSMTSWVLDVAPLFAMSSPKGDFREGGSEEQRDFAGSLRAAILARGLGPKLIETNLVMGIVKVALLVLAMVFSASPLPFATVETTTFLVGWWSFVALLYLAFSDLFQVIRRATYLRLFQALVTPVADITSEEGNAS